MANGCECLVAGETTDGPMDVLMVIDDTLCASTRAQDQGGMSLVEVLLAMALMGMAFTSSLQSYVRLQSTHDLVRQKGEALRWAVAEMENLRRRTEREVADAKTYGVTSFAREMLTLADNLRRAISSVPADAREAARRLRGQAPERLGNPDPVQARLLLRMHADHGLAIDDFSVIASGTTDAAPNVTTTTPPAGATNVGTSSPIVINFSENVADAGAFSLECPAGSPQGFTSAGSVDATHGTSFTLTPSGLPYSTVCTVTVDANKITDTDTNDPPDAMDTAKVFSFTTAAAPQPLTASSPRPAPRGPGRFHLKSPP